MSHLSAGIRNRVAASVALAAALAAVAVGTVNAKQAGGQGAEAEPIAFPPLCLELGILPPRKDPECAKAARLAEPPATDAPPLCLDLEILPPVDDPWCERAAATAEPTVPPPPELPSDGEPAPGELPGEAPPGGENLKPDEYDIPDERGEKQGNKGKKGKSQKGRGGKKGGGKRHGAGGEQGRPAERPQRRPDGTPTKRDPTTTVAPFGPAPVGVPNPVIESFSIPPFLLPIYQACGTEYEIPWQVLASINRIETAFGTNLNVSTAGAVGWMQFLPSTWKAYGVDANGDGRKDPYNPLDAICAAAAYLKASGGESDLRRAIFAYNHADWYVDEVLLYANEYGKVPSGIVDGLVGLTENAHFPVAAKTRYAEARSPRRGIEIFAKRGAPVVAVNDGVIEKAGRSKRLGRFVVLEDAYGNVFTYSGLGKVDVSGGKQKAAAGTKNAALAGRLDALLRSAIPGYDSVRPYLAGLVGLDRSPAAPAGTRKLREGSKVRAGTELAEVGEGDRSAPHIRFAIEPAGRGSKRIDPKPILDGWKLLETTAIYRASGESPFDETADVGEVLLMSKAQLRRRALRDPRLQVYACGRRDIRAGRIDRRVLATLSYLTARGFRLTVTSLQCGHGFFTASGNVSHHSSGNAVDIAEINGEPILGNQGRGSLTETVIRELLGLQGSMQPAQIISLMDMGGPTLTMSDHADHIHVGFDPAYGPSRNGGAQVGGLLEPSQWDLLLHRIDELEKPSVPAKPSRFSLPTRKAKRKRASLAHRSE